MYSFGDILLEDSNNDIIEGLKDLEFITTDNNKYYQIKVPRLTKKEMMEINYNLQASPFCSELDYPNKLGGIVEKNAFNDCFRHIKTNNISKQNG